MNKKIGVSIAGDVNLDQLSKALEWLCKHNVEYTELGIMNCVIAGGRILNLYFVK